jgi:hypothetical protein
MAARGSLPQSWRTSGITARGALKTILGFGVIGVLFSGTLTYRELGLGAAGCTVGAGSMLFGVPVCVYGLGMYLAIVAVAALGLRAGE